MSMKKLPAGWERCPLGEVASIDADLVEPELHPDAPHIAPNHIESRTGRLLPFSTVAADKVISPKHRFRPGQILYSKIRPYLAKAVLVDFEGLCSADMYPISTSLEPGYLHRWLLSEEFTSRVSQDQGRTVLPKVNQAALSKIEIPVPPLGEQRRIVAKLEALLARSRRAKEALDAIPELLEKFRQSVLAAAFRGDLTADWRAQHPDVEPASKLLERIRAERRHRWEEAERERLGKGGRTPADGKWKLKQREPEPGGGLPALDLPQGWGWATLDELAWTTGYGTSAKCDYTGIGYPVLRIPNVAQGKIDLSDLKCAMEKIDLEPSDFLAPGDLLIVRTNGSRELIGRAAVVDANLNSKSYFASYLIRYRLLGTQSLWSWVEFMLGSPLLRTEIERAAATSAGQFNVSLERLKGISIPLPPESERIIALQRLEEALASYSRIEHLVQETAKQAEELERAVLERAFRGELVPQDPNDEPASVLLERIRAERAASTEAAPKRPRAARASSSGHRKPAREERE